MKCTAWSQPLFGVSGALLLLRLAHAVDPNQDARQATFAPGAVTFDMHGNAPEDIMEASNRVPVFSSGSLETGGTQPDDSDRDNDRDSDDNGQLDNSSDLFSNQGPLPIEMDSTRRRDPEWEADLGVRLSEFEKWVTDPENPARPNNDVVVEESPSSTRSTTNDDTTTDTTTNDNTTTDTTKPVRHDIRPRRDPCMMVADLIDGPIPYDVVKACLDTEFDFPESLREDTVATLKSLISNFYVFEDLVARPPTGTSAQGLTFRPVDLIAEMDELLQKDIESEDGEEYHEEEYHKEEGDDEEDDEEEEEEDEAEERRSASDIDPESPEEVEDLKAPEEKSTPPVLDTTTPMTHREFHDGLSRILSKARDGHLSYDADCFRAFRFQHGFFMNHVVRGNTTVLKVHSVTPYFQAVNDVEEDILNCDVVSIAGRDAAEYIQDWADQRVSMSKDANVRFNAALVTPQYRAGTIDFFIPGKFSERYMLPEESSLMFSFHCPGHPPTDLLTVDVKWVGFYTHDHSRPFTDAESYYDSNCIKPREESFGSGGDKTRLEKEQDPEQKDIADLKWALHDLLSEHSPLPLASPVSAAPETETAAAPAPAATTPPIAPVVEPSSPANDARNVDVEEILVKLDMISSEELPVVKFYDDYGGRLGEMNMAAAVVYKELYQGQHGISALLLSDGKTGVITVRAESSTIHGQSYSRTHPAWVGSLIHAINVLRPQAENVILDMSHNTGGFVCIGLTMVQLFFPERPRLVTNIRISPLGSQLMTAGGMGVDHFISSYGDPVPFAAHHISHFDHPITLPHRNLTFTDYLSDRCAITDRYVLQVDPEEERARDRKSTVGTTATADAGVYHPWDPENLAILTDGYCGSSCALIANLMHTKFGVQTVVIGGRTAKDEAMSYSTFPGLQVIDDQLVFREMRNIQSHLSKASRKRKVVHGQQMGRTGEQTTLEGEERKPVSENAPDGNGRGGDKDDNNEDEDEDEDGDEDEESFYSRTTASETSKDDHEDTGFYSESAESEVSKDGDDELPTSYPRHFAHKSRLRLTWRQIYSTGGESSSTTTAEATSSNPSANSMFVPQWSETEYTFLPASLRIDYTDHNVHSIGQIWADARDAVWGAPENADGDLEVDLW
ncbi:hypothetical protein BGZ99_000476 [Dissophora globulifera]|uniref:Tail specific protease domain-containing protein n=1 Tax=Dissophora globulifera TaxID=979702 RepID=A0A9P6RVQ6_9FUNG|nr:hypothetical protein BGZ99_000476 [Dissophora globulifera]